jgi:pyrroline-5-carboxylate reductase
MVALAASSHLAGLLQPLPAGRGQPWAGVCASASKEAAAAAAAAEPPRLQSIPERIGFIGAGQMGEALLRGFLRSKISSPGRICASVRDVERQDALERIGVGRQAAPRADHGLV